MRNASVSVGVYAWDGDTPLLAKGPHGAMSGQGAQVASASCQAKENTSPVCKVCFFLRHFLLYMVKGAMKMSTVCRVCFFLFFFCYIWLSGDGENVHCM